jgi:hypothetical protein
MSVDPKTEAERRPKPDTSKSDIRADQEGGPDVRVDEDAGVGGPDIKPER